MVLTGSVEEVDGDTATVRILGANGIGRHVMGTVTVTVPASAPGADPVAVPAPAPGAEPVAAPTAAPDEEPLAAPASAVPDPAEAPSAGGAV
jgi:hypothetical protein